MRKPERHSWNKGISNRLNSCSKSTNLNSNGCSKSSSLWLASARPSLRKENSSHPLKHLQIYALKLRKVLGVCPPYGGQFFFAIALVPIRRRCFPAVLLAESRREQRDPQHYAQVP